MKNQLDILMKNREIDAFIVLGQGDHNPAMMYLSGGGHFTADVVKKAGKDPSIYCLPMEREEAARTGLRTVLHKSLKAGTKDVAEEIRWMLNESGLSSGRVSFYGRVELGGFLSIVNELKILAPEFEIFGEDEDFHPVGSKSHEGRI